MLLNGAGFFMEMMFVVLRITIIKKIGLVLD